jgi:hypothetical protein
VAKKTWELPAPEPKGDDDGAPIFVSVGAALTSFEVLQEHLSSLFCALVGLESGALRRALGTIESVSQKTTMARYAARISLSAHKELLKRTEDILTEVENFSHRRNDIAHAHVLDMSVNGERWGCYLVPGSHVSKKISIDPGDERWTYRLTAAQVASFEQEFRRVGHAVISLALEISRVQLAN